MLAEDILKLVFETYKTEEKRSAAALSFSLYISLSFRKGDIDS